MDSSGVGTNRFGVYCISVSKAHVFGGCGVKNAGGHGLFANIGSIISAENAIFTGAGHNGIYSGNSSIVHAIGINVSGALVNGMCSLRGSIINAVNANARRGGSDSTNDFFVDNGWIDARGGTGGTNITINTWSTNGYIRK